MPIIGPVVGALARAAATKFAQRGAASAMTRGTISSSQFARGASGLAKFGRTATTVGRGALLMSAFMGNSASNAPQGLATAPSQEGPTKKQGLDTYSDNIY